MAGEDSNHNTVNPTLSFLDLPDLVLECVLRKLPPSGLLTLSCVCKSLRRSCTSDHIWANHLEQKWGKLISPAAEKEWRTYHSLKDNWRKFEDEPNSGKQKGLMTILMRAFSALWPCSLGRRGNSTVPEQSCLLANDSTMYWYFALQNGRFWFPAQVYNRENGHASFMLSCYDAEVCYDSRTDTFQARYPTHGRRSMPLEVGVTWERVRSPPTEITNLPHDLHASDCLTDLRPGDSIEIQWRRNKEFPYGWWYGVIGHLGSCDHQGSQNLCRCHECDDVALEFNQYSPDSRWRWVRISRRNHREEGNEDDGFYGGIRKLKEEEEISGWKRFWPAELLE
ncbi:hypothetical protein MLD38_011747 [Melastoma candidum]|uniref:Uncharacterized protein n=1 Tax=Melastoma candidum TaxID=119954 RepID=A0ACB9R728_9MYRT|nr:hypothetical protein MLD38_011747 [Melastoma candidum]